DDQFPTGGQPKLVAKVAEGQARSAAAVQAATEKAKAELADLDKQLAEARKARDAASGRLADLKQAQTVVTATLKWEGRRRKMTAAQLSEAFAKTRQDLTARLKKLESDRAESAQAAAALAGRQAQLAGLKDPLLRQAEEQGQAEHRKLAEELRKEAGLERPA